MKVVIMAGGQGTRFWPASRKKKPKQFLEVEEGASLLRKTFDRLAGKIDLQDIFVVCGPEYAAPVAAELPELGAASVIVEPVARSTAACIGLAAARLRREAPDDVMAVLPADHLIRDGEEFLHMICAAGELAREGWLVTFGIEPDHPATGYGYIQQGESLGERNGRQAYRVDRFLEKPDRKTAVRLVKTGHCKWNSGMFIWRIDSILEEIRNHMPELSEALTGIDKADFEARHSRRLFEDLQPVQIDVGVLEKSSRVATFPCRFGWSDVGNWRALASVLAPGHEGNVSRSLLASIDSHHCLVHSDAGIVALIGVQDLVVVRDADAVLVCHREQTERVKEIVDLLKKQGREEFL